MCSNYHKNSWKLAIKTIVFILLLCFVIMRLSYLFRNTSFDRNHITGLKAEKNIDVVCIGSSGTFISWEPFRAWKDYGITSYNLATNRLSPALLKSYVKYAMQIQNPDLYIIDLRQINNGDEDTMTGHEGGIRNGIDSFDISLLRLQSIRDCFNYYKINNEVSPESVWSYYFDVAKYHTKWNVLDQNSFENINNNLASTDKGFEFVDVYYKYLVTPDAPTDEIGTLTDRNRKCLDEVLSFCKENDLNTLFIVSLGWISEENMKIYNAAGEMVEERGFDFINCNKYYDEIGLDFAEDLYNDGHCNVFGAEKYTNFMASYIKEHYELEDHRGDEAYKEWDEYLTTAIKKDKAYKSRVENAIVTVKSAHEENLKLKGINEISEWLQKANSDQNTILVVSKKSKVNEIYIPWNVSVGEEDLLRVYTGNTENYSSDQSLDEAYQGTVGTNAVSYKINSGEELRLEIDGKNYAAKDEGTYILVFDNNYNEVMDVIKLQQKGHQVQMTHIQ